jgi:hypothetical protein
VPAEIDFVRDSAGKISELVLHQNGQNLRGKRRLAHAEVFQDSRGK